MGVKLHEQSAKEITAVRVFLFPRLARPPAVVLKTPTLYTALRHAFLEPVSYRTARRRR